MYAPRHCDRLEQRNTGAVELGTNQLVNLTFHLCTGCYR